MSHDSADYPVADQKLPVSFPTLELSLARAATRAIGLKAAKGDVKAFVCHDHEARRD
jgi:hypothetical protein